MKSACKAHRLIPLWEQHQSNTHCQAQTVVADSKYGTVENFLAMIGGWLRIYLTWNATPHYRVQGQDIFPDHRFSYNQSTDTYRCPSGQPFRKHLMERSFVRATRFGFDRARWRRLWRVSIQEYLTAVLQNIEVLVRYGYNPRRRLGVLMQKMKQRAPSIITVQQTLDSYFYPAEIASVPTR